MGGSTPELISFEEAQRLVLGRVKRLPAEMVPVAQAAGRVTVEAAVALVDLPPFESSAMDGFTVRAEDTPGTLPVPFRIAAGRPAPRALAPGAPMPSSPSSMLSTMTTASRFLIALRLAPTFALPAETFDEGTWWSPAAHGWAPRRWRRLRLRESRRSGARGSRAPPCSPPGASSARPGSRSRGLAGYLLETTGGVSVGPHDLVRKVAAELGVEEVFWGVSIKPGKPISFGVLDDRLVFGLPGNPVSVLVGFELFVRPAVLALQGAADPLPHFERGRLTRALEPNPARDELVRARLSSDDEGPLIEPLPGRESHMIARAAAADALVLVRLGTRELAAGEAVDYLRLG